MIFKRRRPVVTKGVKRRLVSVFKRFPFVSLAYLFGSAVEDKTRLSSDIDIAVLFKKRPKPREFLRFVGEAMSAVKFPSVDVVVLNDATPLLGYDVVSSGSLLYFRSEDEINEFEMRIMKRYLDTGWMREKQNRILREVYGI